VEYFLANQACIFFKDFLEGFTHIFSGNGGAEQHCYVTENK